MTMKRTDLAKNLGRKIDGRIQKGGNADRFGKGTGQPPLLNPLIAGLLKKAPPTER